MGRFDWRRNTGAQLVLVVAGSVALRLLAALWMGSAVEFLPGIADQVSYHTLALRLLDGHGFTFGERWWPMTLPDAPTAHWSYLYTFYLAGVYALFGPAPLVARLIQVVIAGVLQPVLAYQIGTLLFGRRVGLVSAVIIAVYAYLVYYAAALMTESFYITAILGTFYFALRLVGAPGAAAGRLVTRRSLALTALGLGLCLGAAVLFRQVFLLFVPVLFAWVGWRGWAQGRLRQTAAALAVAGGVLAGSIVPFTVYNYQRYGEFVLLNTNAGYAFYLANHPIYGTRFQGILPPGPENYWTMLPNELVTQGEARLERELMRRGVQFVLDDPGRYVLLSLSRIPVYFMFWPSEDSSLVSNLSRVLSFGVLWPFMVYGVALALRTAPGQAGALGRASLILVVFAVVYTGIHVFSWALIRYRLPVDAVLTIFAAFGLVDLASRLAARRSAPALT